MNWKRLETKLIHAGEPEPRINGAVVMPVFQSATYQYAGQADYHDLKYIRLNNTPNHVAVHAKLAALENAEAALVTSSGMAAISAALLTVLQAGDHFLVQECLYGGTHDLLTHDFPGFGITYDFIRPDDPGFWKAMLKPRTKAIYVETISNPLLKVPDLDAVVRFAKEHKLVSMIDNTFASPINYRPAEHGFDLSLHSATKYLNGHSDIVAGACIGGKDLIRGITRKLNHLGGSLDPHAVFLLHRGLKTLSVRVRHQNESALRLARFLNTHPAVAKINYPGLDGNPALDGFGGMISLELKGGLEAARRFIGAVKIPIPAPSLGGVESLVTLPSTTSHAGMKPEERRRLGISDGLIRLSVGLEATDDLIEDFTQALA